MKITTLLQQQRTAILKKWFDSVADAYPLETSRFLKTQQDPFANPVGNAMTSGLEGLLEEFAKGAEREKLIRLLDPIIRIRAVQDFSPSQAVGFIFNLKKIIRDFINNIANAQVAQDDLARLEAEIDAAGLLAFDIYMGCRERLYDIKANQERTKVFKAFKRAGLVTEPSEDDPGLTVSNIS